MRPVLAVTGLRAEAAIAAQAGFIPVCAGGVPERTEALLARFLEDGASAIVSFGIAGGLSPALRPGTLLLPGHVLSESGRHEASSPWRQSLLDAGIGIGASLYGAEKPAVSAVEKAALHAATGAVAVDLESHIVARAAAEAGLPFLVVRAIADPAECDLPEAALIPLRPDGTPDLPRIIAATLRQPRQIPALIRLGGHTSRALAALRGSLGPLGMAMG